MEETDLSCARQPPFEAATLEIHNKNRRFDPRNKSGLFRSIEERQGIPLVFDVETPDGYERLPRGVFYQKNGGWETFKNGLFMRFKLVSIIGLLADRRFDAPETLPTTLDGWLRAIVLQLGENFKNRYTIRGGVEDTPLTCAKADVENITCRVLLQYVCMASGTYPRMDTETGKLLVEPPPSRGGVALTLDTMYDFPAARANTDIASITFELGDGKKTRHVVGGNNSAGETPSFANFFIKTPEQAESAARNILRYYGGQRYEAPGRGDLRSELGDIDVIELGFGAASGGRRVKQQLKVTGGVLKSTSHLLQASGETMYSNTVVITRTGPWTAPVNVTEIKLTLIGGGSGGEQGEKGNWQGGAGKGGKGGAGGRIYTETMQINPGQTLNVTVGAGGTAGQPGGDTTLGQYSSRYGSVYDGWVDLSTGNAYGRTGAEGISGARPPVTGAAGAANTGNGGTGGSGGVGASYDKDGKQLSPASPGGAGGIGGSGAVIISYEEAAP